MLEQNLITYLITYVPVLQYPKIKPPLTATQARHMLKWWDEKWDEEMKSEIKRWKVREMKSEMKRLKVRWRDEKWYEEWDEEMKSGVYNLDPLEILSLIQTILDYQQNQITIAIITEPITYCLQENIFPWFFQVEWEPRFNFQSWIIAQ